MSEWSQAYVSSTSYYPPPGAGYVDNSISWSDVFGVGTLDGEPTLLEELEISFSSMKEKSVAVLNPLKAVDKNSVDDDDLIGPVLFYLLLGSFLLPSGKIHFSYIYEVAILGCLLIYVLLNLMSEHGIGLCKTASILGYCLLPVVFLSSLSIFVEFGHWTAGSVFGSVAVLWCTLSSTNMFATLLGMHDQRLLIAYPVAMLYTCFVLVALF